MSFLQTFTGAGVGGAITAAYRAGYQTWEKVRANFVTLNDQFKTGTGSPEGVATAAVGTVYFQTDGIDGTTLWTKVSGSGNTGWAELSTSRIRYKAIPLTDTQIKTLPASAVTIVAAPGAGKRIIPLRTFIDINTAAGAYTNLSADGFLAIEIGGFGLGQYVVNEVAGGYTQLTDLIGAASRRFQSLGPEYEDVSSIWGTLTYSLDTATYENVALAIRGYNGAGNFTGGNAANSMRIISEHMIVSTL